MVDKETLKKVIIEQQNLFKGNYIPRDQLGVLLKKSASDFVIIISGIRRCGKSVLLHQLRKTQNENLYYLNFDDERLFGFETEDFEKLYEVFIELFGEQKTFYFDEIQYIKGWEGFVRRLHDYKNKVFITGSNANLLSKELGTKLTGRHLQLELFPASFKEYVKYNSFDVKKEDLSQRETIARVINLFERYTREGGFFKYLETKDKDFFKTLYENILYRDIISRYSLSNEKGIKDIYHFLTSNISKEFSYTKLKAISTIASVTTIKEYINYFENAYLLFTISLYDVSLKKQLMNPKKAYSIDPGLSSSISFKFSEDKGRLLENIVFLQLKRQGKEIYYHRKKKECDFLIREGIQISQAIQVCHTLDKENREREIGGLIEAMETYGLKEGMILTYDYEETLHLHNKTITVFPVWKWLLV